MGESTGAMGCCRTPLWIYGAGCRIHGVLWASAVDLWGRAEEPWGAVGQHCGTMGQSASLNSTGLAKECVLPFTKAPIIVTESSLSFSPA